MSVCILNEFLFFKRVGTTSLTRSDCHLENPFSVVTLARATEETEISLVYTPIVPRVCTLRTVHGETPRWMKNGKETGGSHLPCGTRNRQRKAEARPHTQREPERPIKHTRLDCRVYGDDMRSRCPVSRDSSVSCIHPRSRVNKKPPRPPQLPVSPPLTWGLGYWKYR